MIYSPGVSRTKIALRKHKIRLGQLDMDKKLDVKKKKKYQKYLEELQLQMVQVQQAYHHQKRRAVLVFEGWDAAGKGGAIKRLTARLDPRGYTVHPIGAPDPSEQGKHYLCRFWRRLPEPGKLAIFDRSWYGRVMVERVEGFAEPEAWRRAYDEINEFERMLIDDGVRVLKFFVHITKKEQKQRFIDRVTDPYKRWKLTTDDFRNRDKWDEYLTAVEEMFDRTSTKAAPWHVIEGNYKWYARCEVLIRTIDHLAKGVDVSLPEPDPEVLKLARKRLDVEIDDD